jgi:hypothetical protein
LLYYGFWKENLFTFAHRIQKEDVANGDDWENIKELDQVWPARQGPALKNLVQPDESQVNALI